MSVALRLADEIDVSRGDMLARADDLPRAAAELEADLVWMSERPLDSDKTYLLKHTTRTVRARVETTGDVATLALNDIGRVRVHCRAPIFCDPYRDNRITGAFILIDSVTNDTVAAGMIARGSLEPPRSVRSGHGSDVSADERRERLGQSGIVVRVLGSSPERAHELAFAIERELFDRGRIATVLTGTSATADAAAACAHAGLIALLPGKRDQGPFAKRDQGPFAVEFGGERLVGEDVEGVARRAAAALEGSPPKGPSQG